MAKKQNKTRKVKKGLMTIPQLRKAFDHIENYTTSLLKSTKDATERRKAFQKEWKKVFHRDVDDKSANAYIEFEEKKVGKSKGTRKQKGGLSVSTDQRGGSASSGLAFYNDINKEAPLAGCGTENTTPKVPISIGSNEVQKGGRRTRKNKRQGGGSFPSISEFAQAMSFRPVPASAPPSSIYTAQMDFKGLPSPPSSQANTATPPYVTYKPTTIAGVATEITRDLGSEIRS
jgi:hypothetical protein